MAIQNHPLGFALLFQPGRGLNNQLFRDLAIGNPSENGGRQEGAEHEQTKYPTCDTAVEEWVGERRLHGLHALHALEVLGQAVKSAVTRANDIIMTFGRIQWGDGVFILSHAVDIKVRVDRDEEPVLPCSSDTSTGWAASTTIPSTSITTTSTLNKMEKMLMAPVINGERNMPIAMREGGVGSRNNTGTVLLT